MEPNYTPDNCRFAFQLLWSFNLYWRSVAIAETWLAPLQAALEADGIRILQHRVTHLHISQFLLSTKPPVTPMLIAQRVKGRLQFLIREQVPLALQRNYCLRSIGATTSNKLHDYVAGQLEHHDVQPPCKRWQLDDLRVVRPNVDLAQPRYTGRAKYWYNLHLVVERVSGSPVWGVAELAMLRTRLIAVASAKRHLLARAAFLPDHVHWLIGCEVGQSPQDIALSYLNNLDHVLGMNSAFRPSAYIGTFGEYDLGALREE